MTNKIIEAARLAGQYADAEYRRAWEEASDGASWQQNRDARFYAIAYKQGLEDLAARFDQPHMEYFGTAIAEAAQELKEQQHG